jgi:hypothetical protein
MKRAALLFHGDTIGLKSLERRMYVVLSFLQVTGIVEHATSVSQYRLLLDRESIVETAMKARKRCDDSHPEIIDTLLSRYDRQFLATLRADRLDNFTRLTNDAE